MSKQREISSEQILYELVQFREDKNKQKGFITKEVNRKKCRFIRNM